MSWLEGQAELDELNPTMAPRRTLGGTFCAEDGYLTPPRNVTAYAVALATSGVQVREHVTFTGLRTGSGRVTGVPTTARPDRRPDRGADRRPPARRGRQAGRDPRPGGIGTRSP